VSAEPVGVPSNGPINNDVLRAPVNGVFDPSSLTTEQLDHVAANYQALAANRKRRITPEQARTAMDQVILGLGAGSHFEHLLRARAAARGLVLQRWHPEQIAEPLVAVCASFCDRCTRQELPELAVASGIADAQGETGHGV